LAQEKFEAQIKIDQKAY
jgi:hypothetical protein